MSHGASNSNPATGNLPDWKVYTARRASVHAPEGSYAIQRAAAELRDAERIMEALEKLLSPSDEHRHQPVDIYLVDPVAGLPEESEASHSAAPNSSNGRLLGVPNANTRGAGGDSLVRTVQPEAPGEPPVLLLTRLLIGRWFGPDAAGLDLFVQGIAGFIAARLRIGPPTQENEEWVRSEITAGRSVSIFPASRSTGGGGRNGASLGADTRNTVDVGVATSFMSFLIDTYGLDSLRRFLGSYDQDRSDKAAHDVYQRSLGALEEAWITGLRRPPGGRAPFGAFVRQIIPLLKPHKLRALEVLVYMLIGLGFNLAMPLASKYLIDNVIPGGSTSQLVVFVVVLFFVYALNSLIGMRRVYSHSLVNQSILIGLQERMFNHLQRLSHNFYAGAKVGDIMSRLSNDLAVVQSAITQVAGTLIYMTLSALGAAIALLILSPLLGGLVVVVIPLFAISYLALRSRLQKASLERQNLIGEAATAAQENLSSQATVKAFGLEERAMLSYRARLSALLKSTLRLVVIGSMFEISTGLAVTVGQLLVLGVGGYLVMQGEITIGTLLAFFGFLPSLFTPVGALAGLGQVVQTASGSMNRVNELLDEPVAIADKEVAAPLPPLSSNIHLEHVTFSYGGDRAILQDLDLTIPAGLHVAIVGPSGSGKSTVVSLLLRFWDPEAGRVLFDGHDVRDVTLGSLRGQIGLVFQDTFVFDTTLRENIGLAHAGATDREIMAAARAARLDSYIEALPAGYDTVLGERGVRMSGGQRQRLAIARALLRDPRILILDEATSALDAQTEREILDTLEDLLPGRTTISITHRLSIASGADRVYVLEAGRLLEEGTHEELLAMGGLYARLYEEQTGYAAAGGKREMESVVTRMKSIPLFARLRGEALAALSGQLVLERYHEGEDVVRQGEPGDKLYFISSGQAEVLSGGRQINTLSDGDYFGEMALLTGEPRSATVRATMPSDLYSLTHADFASLLETEADIRRAVHETVARRQAALASLTLLPVAQAV